MNKDQLRNSIKHLADDYSAKRTTLDKVFKTNLSELCVPYAKEHAKFKIGDTIEKDRVRIIIKEIGAKVDIKNGVVIPVYKSGDVQILEDKSVKVIH